ncbi:hypothetical protein CJ030_MR2G025527 [Morella rubra]|uniref:HTH three-helical bundle domain-containing protein n=1 Tax=Morella rubra TaxID=262757 RepID=A0A6A1WAU0_9ROSI|nr:hypothetical protein CJ030_MR2G025527 [Morella rubra]
MEAFPCPLERTVASALLLLSATPPSPFLISHPDAGSEDQPIKDERKRKSCRESSVLSDWIAASLKEKSRSVSLSCTSSLTSAESLEEIQARQMRIIAVVASSHEKKLQVVRKSRSKIHYCSDVREIKSGKPVKTSAGSASTEASYLSSSSSALSSASSRRSRYVIRTRGEKVIEGMMRKHVCSSHMLRRADDILKLLSGGCSSEMKIRKLLGDSPDTSKALRM